MDNSDFQKFSYEEYKRSHASVEDVYKRYPFALTVIVVLATAVVGIGSNDYWGRFFIDVGPTVYYLGLLGAVASLGTSTAYLMKSVLPKDYEDLGAMQEFAKWRADYRDELSAMGKFTDEQIESAVEKQTCTAVTAKLIEAIDGNVNTARVRMRLYNRSIYAVSIAVVCLGFATVSCWLIKIRNNHDQSSSAAPIAAPAPK